MSKQLSYNKTEKLKSRKQLKQLFTAGKSFTVFPVKIFYASAVNQDCVIKTGVGVGSKFFKKAVERNRIKRLLREAYRTEKLPLHTYLSNNKKQLALFLLYVDKTLPQPDTLKQKIQPAIQKLIAELNEMDAENT